MFRLLARILRTGPSAARLRALELLSERMGLFRPDPAEGSVPVLSDDERAARVEVILGRARQRHAVAQGGGVAMPQENR